MALAALPTPVIASTAPAAHIAADVDGRSAVSALSTTPSAAATRILDAIREPRAPGPRPR